MRERWRKAYARLATVALGLAISPAHAADPPLASSRDPGGTAVAVIARGFDYTRAELARVLARDGEGEAIAWDAVDNDHRPFAVAHDDTGTALAVAVNGSVRIVPVRADLADPTSLARAVAFTAATPARIVLVPLDAPAREALDVTIAAARRFADLLMIVSLPAPTHDERKKTDTADNFVLVAQDERTHAAADAIARALGCAQTGLVGTTGTELKRAFLSRLEKPTAGCQQKTGGPK